MWFVVREGGGNPPGRATLQVRVATHLYDNNSTLMKVTNERDEATAKLDEREEPLQAKIRELVRELQNVRKNSC